MRVTAYQKKKNNKKLNNDIILHCSEDLLSLSILDYNHSNGASDLFENKFKTFSPDKSCA